MLQNQKSEFIPVFYLLLFILRKYLYLTGDGKGCIPAMSNCTELSFITAKLIGTLIKIYIYGIMFHMFLYVKYKHFV